MLEALCALVGCLVLPFLLIFASALLGGASARPRRPGVFAELARRHRRALYVVRESEKHERDGE